MQKQPVRNIATFAGIREMNDANAARRSVSNCRFLFRMLAASIVIVGKYHDIATSDVFVATRWKAVACPTKGKGQQSLTLERFDVFFAFWPKNWLFGRHAKRIGSDKIRNGLKSIRFLVLPARRAIRVCHAVHVVDGTVLLDDLDANRNAALVIHMPA